MTTTQADAPPTRSPVWAFLRLSAYCCMAAMAARYAMDTLGVPPLAILVGGPCILIVWGTVGTRQELRRREAARADAAR
ncbi:hypothetical protein [Candidatus Poriferisodalis sp.]|uniref:hypothetical protein n=1 Tax=Candidatus Poriferisodalis sp. TaxID=3101277 RepID=UPI003B02BA16